MQIGSTIKINECVYVGMYVCMYVCMYVYIHMYHIYVYIYTNKQQEATSKVHLEDPEERNQNSM